MSLKKENLRLNLIFNIIYQIVNVISPLIITPKLSRVFGADYLGVKSYTFSIVYYFSVFGVLGLDLYGQREIALDKDDIDKRSWKFWKIFIARMALGALAIVLYIGFIVFVSSDPFERIILSCWIIYLIRSMINPIWFLQGVEKYRLISILEVISQLAYVICTFCFINNKESLPLYIIFYTAIPLAISFVYMPIVLKHVHWVKCSFNDIKSSISESIVYFIPTIATAIYSMVDKTMLGIFDPTKVSTGLYESAEKLVKVALAISTSSFTIMRTRMSNLFGKNNKNDYSKYSRLFISLSMMLCWPIMFGIMGIAKDFVPLFFGSGFEEVVQLSYYFALVVPCLTISGLLQAIYIFPYGLQKIMDLYYVIIVAVNVTLNFVLIQSIGTVGAIVASISAEFLLALILFIRARKEIPVKFIFTGSLRYLLAAICMFICMKLLSSHLSVGLIYKLIIEFCAAVAIYFVMCFLMRDEFVISLLKKSLLILKKYFQKLKRSKT